MKFNKDSVMPFNEIYVLRRVRRYPGWGFSKTVLEILNRRAITPLSCPWVFKRKIKNSSISGSHARYMSDLYADVIKQFREWLYKDPNPVEFNKPWNKYGDKIIR